MTEHPSLRAALDALASATAPPPADVATIRGHASRLRRRRRANAAVAASLCTLAVLAGLARPHPRPTGLVPATTPTPGNALPTAGHSPSPGATPTTRPPNAPESPDPTNAPNDRRPEDPAAGAPADVPGTAPTTDPGDGTWYAGPVVESPSPTSSPDSSPTASPTSLQPKQTATCNLVVDARSDEGSPAAQAVDLLSGDVASGATQVVAVVRVAGLAGSDLPAQGATWSFGWTLGGTRYLFETARDASGVTSSRLVVTPAGGTPTTRTDVTAVVDVGSRTVRWVTARENVPDLASTTTFTELNATTLRGTGATATNADVATSAATYEDGRPSCLKPA